MARKSNKTSHVLNLLSGTDEEADITMDTPDESPKDLLADIIKDKLLEEMEPETVEPEVLAPEPETVVPEPEVVAPEPEIVAPEPEVVAPEPEVLAPEPEVVVSEPEVVVPVIKDLEEMDYSYVNVMESIVKDKVLYFNTEFNMCSCDRCLSDTTALALSNLPPKYIVTETSSISPLMNYYTNKYIGQVTVELTKACMIVKEHPHHKRT